MVLKQSSDMCERELNSNVKEITKNKLRQTMNFLTWEIQVYIVDSPVQQTDASLLNPAGCCYSGPVLSH